MLLDEISVLEMKLGGNSMDSAFRLRGRRHIAIKTTLAAILLLSGAAIGAAGCFLVANTEPVDEGESVQHIVMPTDYGEADNPTPDKTSNAVIDGAEDAAGIDAQPNLEDDPPEDDPPKDDPPKDGPPEDGPPESDPPEDSQQPIERELYYIDRWVSFFSAVTDEDALGELGPQTVEIIEREGNWIRVDTGLGENWVDIYSIRQTVRLDVPSYDQRGLGYPLGCELVALAMMMNYETEVSVHDLYRELPRADHPNEGFRGDPASSTRGWTIFPPALTGMMEKHLGNSHDMSGLEIDDLKKQLNTNTPVLVWIRGLGWPVHALCLTGYDKNGFYYNDPWTGQKNTFISYGEFYEIWNDRIYDRVLDLTYDPRKALSYLR